MILILLRYIFGFVKVEVSGFAPERFMNLLIHNEIVVWDVVCIKQGYIFKTGRKNLLQMKPFLQKTNMKLKILEKKDFLTFVKRIKEDLYFF